MRTKKEEQLKAVKEELTDYFNILKADRLIANELINEYDVSFLANRIVYRIEEAKIRYNLKRLDADRETGVGETN